MSVSYFGHVDTAARSQCKQTIWLFGLCQSKTHSGRMRSSRRQWSATRQQMCTGNVSSDRKEMGRFVFFFSFFSWVLTWSPKVGKAAPGGVNWACFTCFDVPWCVCVCVFGRGGLNGDNSVTYTAFLLLDAWHFRVVFGHFCRMWVVSVWSVWWFVWFSNYLIFQLLF